MRTVGVGSRLPVPGRALLMVAVLLMVVSGIPRAAADGGEGISRGLVEELDAVARDVLDQTGVPGASLAVVLDGAIVYTQAYGLARLDPETAATPAMRFPIGSISKQFTATAVAMLARDGRLSLDDTVSRFLPTVTRAEDITLRQLLSHTSGIRDYWPQDYVPATMLEPISTMDLMERFATQPLDFEPGTQYQYSNTGYVLAGAIVEKVSGQPLSAFLTERVFKPLGMGSVVDLDREGLADTDPVGYQRFALGPSRVAPAEGRGWLFAAGALAMTAEDLARWNVALIACSSGGDDGADERASGPGLVPGGDVLGELGREIVLRNGAGTGYGLGLAIELQGNRRVLGHGGEVSGFTATNLVHPEERFAVSVLTNQDAARASESIARRVVEKLRAQRAAADAGNREQVRAIYDGLRRGTIDRALLTPNGSDYFSETALADIRASLRHAGRIKDISQTYEGPRGGLMTRTYTVSTKRKTLHVVTRTAGDGRLEQYTIAIEE